MHIRRGITMKWKADDIIGTLAKAGWKEELLSIHGYTDKKIFVGQLVSENIFSIGPARLENGIEIWGIPESKIWFGVGNSAEQR